MSLTLNLNTNESTALKNLSVILPVFNGAEHLQETLLSIEKQSLKDIEIIAIDDDSSDLSVSILGRVPALRLLHSKRTGPNVSRQMALSYASGSYIAFLDQDDLWHPDHLRLAVQALSANPQATAWIGPRVRFTDSIKNLGRPATLPRTINPAEFFPINLIDTPSEIETARGWWLA
jgi:glycosyltransferase involved in cell wall biosynthesis